MPSVKNMELTEIIKWQRIIIKHDHWVVRTAKTHKPAIVKFHKAQLKWTTKELKQSLKKFAAKQAQSPQWLIDAFMCIHRYEGAWDSNTGNGYYGGLQFGSKEWSRFGGMYAKYAYDATPMQQIQAGINYYQVSGFHPWPRTARACGLL